MHELKVMTWNVHCTKGADSLRQRRIAERIMAEDADFILLNEYNQDNCIAIDSLLKTVYPYSEEHQSHKNSGDFFIVNKSCLVLDVFVNQNKKKDSRQ